MSTTTAPYLERLPDGRIVAHGATQPALAGYVRRPLKPRFRRAEPVLAAIPAATAPVPAGLIDVHAASVILDIPAAILDGWARRNPARVPAARIISGVVYFDPTALAVA